MLGMAIILSACAPAVQSTNGAPTPSPVSDAERLSFKPDPAYPAPLPSKCEVLTEALLTGTDAEINESLWVLFNDENQQGFVRSKAKSYYETRRSGRPGLTAEQSKMFDDITRGDMIMACSIGKP